MFVTTNRVLVIGRVDDAEGGLKRLRIKNGEEFFTVFPSKKLPPIPASVKEGSQVDLSGFLKAKFDTKYGMQFTMTATAIVERNTETGKAKNTITEAGEPVDQAPGTEAPEAPKK